MVISPQCKACYGVDFTYDRECDAVRCRDCWEPVQLGTGVVGCDHHVLTVEGNRCIACGQPVEESMSDNRSKLQNDLLDYLVSGSRERLTALTYLERRGAFADHAPDDDVIKIVRDFLHSNDANFICEAGKEKFYEKFPQFKDRQGKKVTVTLTFEVDDNGKSEGGYLNKWQLAHELLRTADKDAINQNQYVAGMFPEDWQWLGNDTGNYGEVRNYDGRLLEFDVDTEEGLRVNGAMPGPIKKARK